jgi:hypothetical protein
MSMNREDVIRIALEVGFYDGEVNKCQLMLERFAYLVAQQEREACIKAIEDQIGWDMDNPESTAIKAIRAKGQP